MKKRLLLATCLTLLSHAAIAAPACYNPYAFTTLADTGIGYTRYDIQYPDRYRDTYDYGKASDWVSLLEKHGLSSALKTEDFNGYNYSECDFNSARDAFDALKDDVDAASQKLWLQNQDRVLEACIKHKADELYQGTDPRLQAEYAYQSLARSYHLDAKTAGLIEGFSKIAYTKGHPRQKDAARSLVSVIMQQKGANAAWAETGKLRNDPATAALYPYIEDVRFIIMGQDDESYNDEGQSDLNTRIDMLRWLLAVVEGHDNINTGMDATRRAEFKRTRQADAYRRLDNYVTSGLFEHGKPPVLDWWLLAATPETAKLQAVKTLIKDDDLLAWMYLNQTHQFAALTRMYDATSPVRAGQQNLSGYAFNKFKTCKGGEWLLPALENATASQQNLPDMIAAANTALDDTSLKSTQDAYRGKLWSAAVAVLLLDDKYAEALDMLFRPDINNGWETRRAPTLVDTLSWFIHRGEYDWARRVVARNTGKTAIAMDGGYGDASTYKAYKIMLAQTPEEFLQLLAELDEPAATSELMQPVWDMLSGHVLLDLADADTLPVNVRTAIAKTVYTRGWVLNDQALARRAALLLEKVDATGDKTPVRLLGASKLDQYLFFLRHPRMRPTGAGFATSDTPQNIWNGQDIDQYNHNDNNWWCTYKPDDVKARLNDAWSLPVSNPYIKTDKAVYEKARADAIAAHPLFKLIDRREQEALAKIPNGARFLGEKMVSYTQGARGVWALITDSDAVPEGLHLTVRAAHYGCNRNELAADYAGRAFWLLHKFFAKTPWADATPYWYDIPKTEAAPADE